LIKILKFFFNLKKKGEFISQKELFKFNQVNNNNDNEIVTDYDSRLDNPQIIRVLNNTMAVLDSNSCIYMYNTDGYLRQSIKIAKISAFSLISTYMLVIVESGPLTTFESKTADGLYTWEFDTTNSLDDIYSDMCLFKDRWILASCLAPRLSAISLADFA
jgi:hypothetical protein